jgi:hypothetical protein
MFCLAPKNHCRLKTKKSTEEINVNYFDCSTLKFFMIQFRDVRKDFIYICVFFVPSSPTLKKIAKNIP